MPSFFRETLSKTIAAVVSSLIVGLLAILAAAFGINFANSLTRQVVSILLFITLSGTMVFILTAKRQMVVHPKVFGDRFGKPPKTISIMAVVLSLVPVWFAFQPETQYSILVRLKVHNATQSEVIISNRAEIWIWSSSVLSEGGPRFTGVLKLYGQNGLSQDTYTIPKDESINLMGDVQAAPAFKPYLESASWDFSVTLAESNGRHVFMNGKVPFDKETIQQYYIPIDISQ